MDSLIEFPYGCVEQTSSRMLPLSMALESLTPPQQSAAPLLAQRLASARTSLAAMAGPQARFGWWGRDMHPDAFLTAYAYYADWRAAQALHLTLPAEHWQLAEHWTAARGPDGSRTGVMGFSWDVSGAWRLNDPDAPEGPQVCVINAPA